METDKAVRLLRIERECVRRAETCDRNCAECELVQPAQELTEMYGEVIEKLEAEQKNTAKWRVGEHSYTVEMYDGSEFWANVNCTECGGWGESRMRWCPWCGRKITGVGT